MNDKKGNIIGWTYACSFICLCSSARTSGTGAASANAARRGRKAVITANRILEITGAAGKKDLEKVGVERRVEKKVGHRTKERKGAFKAGSARLEVRTYTRDGLAVTFIPTNPIRPVARETRWKLPVPEQNVSLSLHQVGDGPRTQEETGTERRLGWFLCHSGPYSKIYFSHFSLTSVLCVGPSRVAGRNIVQHIQHHSKESLVGTWKR